MNRIDHSSLLKREAWLKKKLRALERWKLDPSASDYQQLKHHEMALYSIIFMFGVFFLRRGVDSILEAEHWLDHQLLIPVFLLVYVSYLAYSVARLRWALEAFEQFAPQELKELSDRIAGESETPRDRNPVQMEDPAGGLSQ